MAASAANPTFSTVRLKRVMANPPQLVLATAFSQIAGSVKYVPILPWLCQHACGYPPLSKFDDGARRVLGMRALLVLYMVKLLLLPGHSENVIGLTALKSFFESIFGPLGVQPFSSHIYGLYTGLVYLTPIFGGMLADRVLGQHRTIVLGAAMMAIGHFMMAFESLFLLALTMLILGNGAFKPNMSAQVGGLYAPGDQRRDRAYSIFYVGINLGAFLAPLVCGTLGEQLGWHYGFAAAGIGMTIGLAIYLYAYPTLPPDELQRTRQIGKRALTSTERRGVISLL